MIKPYTAEKVINGKKYVAQFSGWRTALEATDQGYINVDGTATTSMVKMADYVFKHAIVEPSGLSLDDGDFEDVNEIAEIVKFGLDVMHGRFHPKKDEATTK